MMDTKVEQELAPDNHLDDLGTSCKQNDRSLGKSPSGVRRPRRFLSGSSSVQSSRSSVSSSSIRSPSTPSSSYTIPPDGGYGWLVVFASFWCNVIVDGIIFAFGVLLLEFTQHFKTSRATAAWIGSLQTGSYLMIGPLVSCIANRYGCRMTTLIGSMIASFGFLISFWANSVLWLAITYGVIGGIGFGFIYLPAIVTVGYYFESKRAFATGIAVCGSGIGTFIMPPLVQFLIQSFGWRGCLLILSGLVLICVLFGSLFRPVAQLVHPASISSIKRNRRLSDDVEDDDGAEERSRLTEQETLKSESTVRSGSSRMRYEEKRTGCTDPVHVSDERTNPDRRSMPDLISVFTSNTPSSACDHHPGRQKATRRKNIVMDDTAHDCHEHGHRPRTLTGDYCHPDHNDDRHRQFHLNHHSPCRFSSQPVVLVGIRDFSCCPDLEHRTRPLHGNKSFALNLSLDFNQGIALAGANDCLIKEIDRRDPGKENRITAVEGVNDQQQQERQRHQRSEPEKGSKERQDGDGNGIIGRKAENDPLNESSEEGKAASKVQDRDARKIGRLSKAAKERRQETGRNVEEGDSERISDTKSMKIDMSPDSSSTGRSRRRQKQQQRLGLHAGQTSIEDPDIGVGKQDEGEGDDSDDEQEAEEDCERKKRSAAKNHPDSYDVGKEDEEAKRGEEKDSGKERRGQKSGAGAGGEWVKVEGEEDEEEEAESEVVARTQALVTGTGNKSCISSSTSEDGTETKKGKKSLLRSLLTDLMDTMDPELLSKPSFLLLALSGFLTLAGFFIPFTYIVHRAILQGVSQQNSAYLLSVIGITNTVGRVFCGWISDHPKVNALAINNAALVICGGITLLSPFLCNSFLSLVVYGAVFGFSIACFAALRSVITVELLGLEKLTNAFGLLLLPQGIATIIGTPFAGLLYDVTGSYDSSFYVAGSLITISGLMCLPLRRLADREASKAMRLREDRSSA